MVLAADQSGINAMKILVFSSIAVVTLLLVGLQHQQLSHLRAENATLQQSAAEADQLNADRAKSSDDQAQDAEEIARLQEENHDLLRLRNEVNQLRDARATFEKVTAENQRLQMLARSAVRAVPKQASMQPILIRVDSLYDRGQGTPEAAAQTLLWAEHNGNVEVLSRCMEPKRWSRMYSSASEQARKYLLANMRRNLAQMVSIGIVARRDIDAATVQLGIELHSTDGRTVKIVYTLNLQGGNWIVDPTVYQ